MKLLQHQPLFRGLILFSLLTLVLAHGHDDAESMDMPGMDTSLHSSNSSIQLHADPDPRDVPSYFRDGGHSSLMVTHIVLMSLAWVVVLPLVVMLSIGRSRLSLPLQFVFLVLNAIGVFVATIYKNLTPDLYPHNAHHPMGWLLMWIVCVQSCLALIEAYTKKDKDIGHFEERAAFIPISSQAMVEHERMHNDEIGTGYRYSNDSGQGTEPNTESLRSQSLSSISEDNEPHVNAMRERYVVDEELDIPEKPRSFVGGKLDKFLSKKLPAYLSSRTLYVFSWILEIINRLILQLGFVGLTTGFITYGGIFRAGEVFSGLAHWIKGGVFFWYGILTLGRWAGCFSEIGWAWNIKPATARKANYPSAEFVESFLIFFYGSTNIFLEHLGGWGGAWSAQDFEHISITVMFLGGGLCGMLIESQRVRDLLNVTISQARTNRHAYGIAETEDPSYEPPKSYTVPMNPVPALIVLLLGIMMSSHHQESMVSTMIHKQWGTLLVGGAFARGLTYIIFYLSPPVSVLPSRPPSELITAFCLLAGGFIFMASSHDTVWAIETNGLDAMIVFTISMGFITLLMAWIILVIAIKGWAVRRESKTSFLTVPSA